VSDLAALVRRFDEAMAAQDALAAASMSPDDVEYLDHRALGWEPVRGRGALETHYQSIFDAAEGIRVTSEIVEERGDTVLVRQASSFQAHPEMGGGEGVMVMLTLVTMRDGKFAKIEIFDDERAARAAMAQGTNSA